MASSKFYCRYITMIMVCILILSLCIFKKKESFISVLPTVIAYNRLAVNNYYAIKVNVHYYSLIAL